MNENKLLINTLLDRKDVLENRISENNDIFPYFKKEDKDGNYFKTKIINGEEYHIIAYSKKEDLNINIYCVSKFPDFNLEKLKFTDIYFVIEELEEENSIIIDYGFSELYDIKIGNQLLFIYTYIDDGFDNTEYQFYEKTFYTFILDLETGEISNISDEFDDDINIETYIEEFVL